MSDRKKGSKKKRTQTSEDAEESPQATSSSGARFLPCPGLTTRELEEARVKYADYYDKHGKRPKENIKYTFEDKEQIDYIRDVTAKNVCTPRGFRAFRYYKDRLMVSRGPCNLHVLRNCWTHGVIDENTLVWGQGLADWLPVKNVRTLIPQIRTVEVQVASWLKRTLGLKPALRRIRKERAAERPSTTDGGGTSQVDRMY